MYISLESDTLKKLCRKGTLPLTDDAEGINFLDETCTEKPQNKREGTVEMKRMDHVS